MSSPAGLQHSQLGFLTRWLPSSARAGVVLSPCPGLAGSLGLRSSVGSPSLEPDDSFASDFAPLPASADSSCLGADGFARSAGAERRADGPLDGLVSAYLDGELESLDEMESKSQDLPLVMKLEQLRKWQQHMQEQLKAHQLEELLRLQEEQQRLLGMMSGPQQCTLDDSEASEGGAWPYSPDGCGPPQDQPSPRGQDAQQEDQWDSAGGETSRFHDDTLIQSTGAAPTEDDGVVLDRPIKSSVKGHKTFEELVEEQLRLEELRLEEQRQQQSPPPAPPKRAFLKRGEGLSRFTSAHKAVKKDPKPPVQTRAVPRSASEPAAGQRLPVQRKTAPLRKEDRLRGLLSPPQDKRARMKGSGSQQRRRSEEVNQTSMQPNPVTKQQVATLRGAGGGGGRAAAAAGGGVGAAAGAAAGGGGAAAEGRGAVPVATGAGGGAAAAGGGAAAAGGGVGAAAGAAAGGGAAAEGRGAAPVATGAGGGAAAAGGGAAAAGGGAAAGGAAAAAAAAAAGGGAVGAGGAADPQESFEASFQEKLRHWDSERRLESMELGEFELLEEAAEELSFSSNSSFVLKVLQMDQQHRRLHPRRLSSTPIKAPPSPAPQMSSCADVVEVRGDALQQSSDASSCGDSSSGGQEVKPHSFPSILCFPAPYDKRSYQDEDGVLGSADESTLIEDEDGQPRDVVFDDDDTWNDLEDAASVTASSANESAALQKVPDPPAASQLMVKLFPSLKAHNAPPPPPPPPPAAEPRQAEDPAQQVQSRQLRDRLVQLEVEIQRFKKENAALAALRLDNDKKQEQLRKERSQFERQKEEETARFEEYKKEENRKLQKERKVFEKHAAAARAAPDKKEREEIQALKQQISSLQEELRGKESRWTSTTSRLRQQIDSLSQENGSLREEIRTLEKLRLSAWTKDKEPRDNVSSGTKGVKFATPLDSSPPQTSCTSRRSSRDISHGAAVGMKSSLRRPSGPSSSSSSSSSAGRRSEERSTQDKPQDQRCSPERDSPPEEAQDPEPVQVFTHPDGRTETVLPGGDRLIVFSNGTKKEVSADGLTVKVTFFNGDTKEVTADQRVIYFYADAQTTHVTYPDGVEVLLFPNSQTEKHFPDGRKEITFPDQTVKNLFPSGLEESVLTDGTVIRVNPDGTKEILFNTGQKEIHTAGYKRREYPDGTVKTVYADGRQETRYPTGRLRVKDKDGNVVLDNGA